MSSPNGPAECPGNACLVTPPPSKPISWSLNRVCTGRTLNELEFRVAHGNQMAECIYLVRLSRYILRVDFIHVQILQSDDIKSLYINLDIFSGTKETHDIRQTSNLYVDWLPYLWIEIVLIA